MNLEHYFHLIEQHLSALISDQPLAPHRELFTAARYSLLSSGKRLRPLLTLATAEAFDIPLEKALLPACAIELIHTYSLIHDDLPCMDDDDLRRGQPTLHKIYNEGHAVLTGDFLLTYAFQVLSEAPLLRADQKIELIRALASSAGGEGMIGGQVVDLAHMGKEIDLLTLQFMHLGKTAALITTSLEFGGIIAEAGASDRKCLRQLGKDLGLAYQIVDDILDSTDSTDIQKNKPTAVALLGREKAQQTSEELFASALDSLSALSRPAPLLKHLAHKLVFRSI